MNLKHLWRDQSGVVNTTDVILMTAILAIGMIVGLVSLRNQVVQELTDVASAVGFLNQGYSYEGNVSNTDLDPNQEWLGTHEFAGSSYDDKPDFGEEVDVAGAEPGGISVRVPPASANKTPGEDGGN